MITYEHDFRLNIKFSLGIPFNYVDVHRLVFVGIEHKAETEEDENSGYIWLSLGRCDII